MGNRARIEAIAILRGADCMTHSSSFLNSGICRILSSRTPMGMLRPSRTRTRNTINI